MPRQRSAENILLVEGKEDLRVIPELVEKAGVPWGPPDAPIVAIKDYDGKKNLLRTHVLTTEFKTSGARRIGILVDADEDCGRTWQSIREFARRELRDPDVELDITIPDTIPCDGWSVRCAQTGRSFGVWIMPDNVSRGMLETFLQYLVPDQPAELWTHAQDSTTVASRLAAPFTPAHLDKANIHVWLAWQDPPGRQLHDAVKQRILQADSHRAEPFVAWFCRLYELQRTDRTPAP